MHLCRAKAFLHLNNKEEETDVIFRLFVLFLQANLPAEDFHRFCQTGDQKKEDGV
jgi:hypothetical protein